MLPGASTAAQSASGRARPEPACCPYYHQAVELIGRRWTGAILEILLQGGPLRFSTIAAAVPGPLRPDALRPPQGARVLPPRRAHRLPGPAGARAVRADAQGPASSRPRSSELKRWARLAGSVRPPLGPAVGTTVPGASRGLSPPCDRPAHALTTSGRSSRSARDPLHPPVVHRRPRAAEVVLDQRRRARRRARGGDGLRRLLDHRLQRDRGVGHDRDARSRRRSRCCRGAPRSRASGGCSATS